MKYPSNIVATTFLLQKKKEYQETWDSKTQKQESHCKHRSKRGELDLWCIYQK